MAVGIENTSWLRQLLIEVQLEQFYLKLRDELQVSLLFLGLSIVLMLHFRSKLDFGYLKSVVMFLISSAFLGLVCKKFAKVFSHFHQIGLAFFSRSKKKKKIWSTTVKWQKKKKRK